MPKINKPIRDLPVGTVLERCSKHARKKRLAVLESFICPISQDVTLIVQELDWAVRFGTFSRNPKLTQTILLRRVKGFNSTGTSFFYRVTQDQVEVQKLNFHRKRGEKQI